MLIYVLNFAKLIMLSTNPSVMVNKETTVILFTFYQTRGKFFNILSLGMMFVTVYFFFFCPFYVVDSLYQVKKVLLCPRLLRGFCFILLCFTFLYLSNHRNFLFLLRVNYVTFLMQNLYFNH